MTFEKEITTKSNKFGPLRLLSKLKKSLQSYTIKACEALKLTTMGILYKSYSGVFSKVKDTSHTRSS